jgi:hypothetical protein
MTVLSFLAAAPGIVRESVGRPGATQPDTVHASTVHASTVQADTIQADTIQADTIQDSVIQPEVTRPGTAANWASSLSHLIPGHETMHPFELEQLVMYLTSTTRGATRPGPGRRRR